MRTAVRCFLDRTQVLTYEVVRPAGRLTFGEAKILALEDAGPWPPPEPSRVGKDCFSLVLSARDKVVRLHVGPATAEGLPDWKKMVQSFEVTNPAAEGDYPGVKGVTWC